MATIVRCALAMMWAGALLVPATASAEDSKGGLSLCAQYGQGFMRAPNSDTCIKMGGSMQFDAGTGQSLGNADNFGGSSTITSLGATSGSGSAAGTTAASAPKTPATSSLSSGSSTGAAAPRAATDPWRQAR